MVMSSKSKSSDLFLLHRDSPSISLSDPLVAYFPVDPSLSSGLTQSEIDIEERHRDTRFGRLLRDTMKGSTGVAIVIKEYWGNRLVTYRWGGTIVEGDEEDLKPFLERGELSSCLRALRDLSSAPEGGAAYGGPVRVDEIKQQMVTYWYQPKTETNKRSIGRQAEPAESLTVHHGKWTCGIFCPGRTEGEDMSGILMPEDPRFCIPIIDLPDWMTRLQDELGAEQAEYEIPGDGSCYFSLPVKVTADGQRYIDWGSGGSLLG